MSDILTSMVLNAGNTGNSRPETGLLDDVLEVLAEIRAIPSVQLRSEVQAAGIDRWTLSSQEVVALLVTLQPKTGIDPADPDILKDCEVQTVEQLLTFIRGRIEATS